MPRTMLYHRTLAPRIVETADECARLLAEGWADTPAAFTDQEEAGDGDTQEGSQPDAQTLDPTPAPLPARRRRKP